MPNLKAGSYAEVFGTVVDDIVLKSRQYRSIVTVSWGSTSPVRQRNFFHYQDIVDDIWNITTLQHVPIVFAAGNHAQAVDMTGRPRLPTDTFPAALVDENQLEGLLGVANSNLIGERWRTSQRTRRHGLFAPGVDIKCAALHSNFEHQTSTGTSFCDFPPLSYINR